MPSLNELEKRLDALIDVNDVILACWWASRVRDSFVGFQCCAKIGMTWAEQMIVRLAPVINSAERLEVAGIRDLVPKWLKSFVSIQLSIFELELNSPEANQSKFNLTQINQI